MNNKVNLSIAIDTLNRKIANLNMQIVNGDNSEETKKELESCLKMRQDIFNGNVQLIEKVIDGEI